MQIPDHLYNERYDDRYFDVVNALEESKHVFMRGNRIVERLAALPQGARRLVIGETGFGAGRNVLALMAHLTDSGVRDITIDYRSVDLHPLTPARIEAILQGLEPGIRPLSTLLVAHYATLDMRGCGWRSMTFERPFGTLTVSLYIGEALAMVHSMPTPADAWFLDGHAPKKNPDIWREELLLAIGAATVTGGTVATYTAAGHVRRALNRAGFCVTRPAGTGGKKMMIAGVKLGENSG